MKVGALVTLDESGQSKHVAVMITVHASEENMLRKQWCGIDPMLHTVVSQILYLAVLWACLSQAGTQGSLPLSDQSNLWSGTICSVDEHACLDTLYADTSLAILLQVAKMNCATRKRAVEMTRDTVNA